MLKKFYSIISYNPQAVETINYFCAGPSNMLRKSINVIINTIYYSYRLAKKIRKKKNTKECFVQENLNKHYFSKILSIKNVKDNFQILIETNIEGELHKDKCFNVKFNYPENYIALCKDVEIIGGTRIIKKENCIYHDELFTFRSSDYGIKDWNNLKIDNQTYDAILTNISKENTYIKNGILISCDHDNNYFHWMVESLPMLLYAIENIELYKNYDLLIPKELHQNYKEALYILLSKLRFDNNIYELNSNKLYRVNNLIVPSDFSRILDRYHGDLDNENDIVLNPLYIKKVRKKLIINSDVQVKRKLYLTRRSGTYRKLLNEKEIEIYLLRKGFEIIDLSNVTFEYQRVLFSQANLIIAPTGATMTNMILAPSNSIFIVLFSDHILTEEHYLNGKKIGLWNQLADICDVELYQINGCKAGHREDVHDDFTVPIEKIENILKKIKY